MVPEIDIVQEILPLYSAAIFWETNIKNAKLEFPLIEYVTERNIRQGQEIELYIYMRIYMHSTTPVNDWYLSKGQLGRVQHLTFI